MDANNQQQSKLKSLIKISQVITTSCSEYWTSVLWFTLFECNPGTDLIWADLLYYGRPHWLLMCWMSVVTNIIIIIFIICCSILLSVTTDWWSTDLTVNILYFVAAHTTTLPSFCFNKIDVNIEWSAERSSFIFNNLSACACLQSQNYIYCLYQSKF